MGLNNKSGYIGVSWEKRRNVWNARIQVNKVNIRLGYFERIEDAIRVRHEAEILYFQEFRSTA